MIAETLRDVPESRRIFGAMMGSVCKKDDGCFGIDFDFVDDF